MFETVIAAFVVWLLVSYVRSGDVPSQQPGGSDAGSDAGSYNPLAALADAWANAEGWNKPGSLAQRTDNPVNIHGTWPGSIGKLPSGQAIFSDSGSGFAAAQSWLQQQAIAHPTWTFYQLFAKVLGNLQGNPVDNDQGNSNQEAETVASELGVDPSTEIGSYLGGS